jgi:hypothetical protein
MNKPYSVRVKRQSFIQLCRSNPKEGAEYLRKIADKIEQSKKTPEIIRHLESVLFLTERTIYRDL